MGIASAAISRLFEDDPEFDQRYYSSALVAAADRFDDAPLAAVCALCRGNAGLFVLSSETACFADIDGDGWATSLDEVGSLISPSPGTVSIDFDDGSGDNEELLLPEPFAVWIVEVFECLALDEAAEDLPLVLESRPTTPGSVTPYRDGSSRVALSRLRYLGGYPECPDPLPIVSAYMEAGRITVMAPRSAEPLVALAPGEILSVEVDGPSDVRNRVTVPRVLALGVIALAVPKRDKLAYLVVTTPNGELILEDRSATPHELRAKLQAALSTPARVAGSQSNVLQQPPAPLSMTPGGAATAGGDSSQADPVSARLARLKDLHAQGLITADDYDLRRREILAEL